MMVARPAVQDFDVHVGARALSESFEEIRHQLGLKITNVLDLQAKIHHRMQSISGSSIAGKYDRALA